MVLPFLGCGYEQFFIEEECKNTEQVLKRLCVFILMMKNKLLMMKNKFVCNQNESSLLKKMKRNYLTVN